MMRSSLFTAFGAVVLSAALLAQQPAVSNRSPTGGGR